MLIRLEIQLRGLRPPMALYSPPPVSKTLRVRERQNAGSDGDMARTVMRCGVWLSLAGWVGGFALFAGLVAPTAFQVLPRELAGRIVSPILEALHLYAAAAGIALAALAQGLGRSKLLRVLPLVLAGVCLYSQFGVTPHITEARELAFSPQGNSEALLTWGKLHRQSMVLFTSAGVGALILLVLHTWEDARSAR